MAPSNVLVFVCMPPVAVSPSWRGWLTRPCCDTVSTPPLVGIADRQSFPYDSHLSAPCRPVSSSFLCRLDRKLPHVWSCSFTHISHVWCARAYLVLFHGICSNGRHFFYDQNTEIVRSNLVHCASIPVIFSPEIRLHIEGLWSFLLCTCPGGNKVIRRVCVGGGGESQAPFMQIPAKKWVPFWGIGCPGCGGCRLPLCLE